MNREIVIDSNLIVDGLLFATPGHRCRYLGTSNRDKPRWLEDNKGGYQRIEDVLQESAQLGPHDVGVALPGPNCEISSRDIGKDADDDHNVSLIGPLPEHRSPPHQPTSLPGPADESVPDGPTQPELLACAKVATSEATAPKTEATPLGTMGCKRGRSSRYQRKNQKLLAGTSKFGRTPSPESMRFVLDSLTKCPVIRNAAREAGLHRKTIERWIKCNRAGHDGYDVEWQGFTWRFHEASEVAVDEAHETLEGNILELAIEVVFKTDPFLVDLGFKGRDAYATDEHGNFIREGIRIRNMRLALLWLSWKRPEIWGKPPKRRFCRMLVYLSSATPPRNPNVIRRQASKPESGRRSREWFGRPKPDFLWNFRMAAHRPRRRQFPKSLGYPFTAA